MGSRSRSRSRSEGRHQERHVIHVQSDMAGVLIGKGGETINSLQRQSGASIHVSRDEASGTERAVTIRGHSEAIDKAVASIEELIAREKNRNPRPEADEEKKVMYVSGTFVGMIIGRGGESIKAMSRQSGARIEVSKDDLADRDADRTVTIMGTAEAVQKASRMIEDIVSRSEEEPHFGPAPRPRVVEAPAGFEACDYEDWLYNSATQEYFSKNSGALAWRNESTGLFCPIREGVKHQDVQVLSAGTGVLSADNSAAALPKTVVIPDLHRVAMALKLPFDHVDHPCAMLAVFGGSEPAAAAMNFHEKLLRRISSWRSVWMDQAWLLALNGAIMDLAAGGGAVVMAAALQLGPKVVAVASPGAHLALALEGRDGALQALPVATDDAGSGAFALLQREAKDSNPNPSILLALLTGSKPPSIDDVSRFLLQGRPRAAAVHLARKAREAGDAAHLATACARLSFIEEEKNDRTKVPDKKPKLEEKLNKVRVRQILIRFWSGKGPHPINPLSRKPVLRKLDAAELMMLELLDKLLAQNCQNFASLCKLHSECGSAMKGGADNGDLGWLDQAKVAALARAKGQPLAGPSSVVQSSVPVAVVKAAFELKKGELSDIVVSEMGVHLVQRTG